MPHQRLSPELVDLPQGWLAALVRGARGNCPRCGEAALFRAWLKPVDRCAHCKQDWSVQQADDFPAYIGIFVVGHLLAPVVIAMISGGVSAWVALAILLPVAVLMLLVMLQPTKGAVIAFLWWHGIGAFTQERRQDTPEP
jgi:uncharacterized protein (DUF983 family)